MDIFAAAERLMAMDERTWARHANPWSVWSRFSCLPLIALAVWSRDWLDWWCLLPVVGALLWARVNPRAFPPPETTNSWASKGTFGERVYLNRKQIPIPEHHLRASRVLTAVSALGAVILILGLVALDLWATLCGLILAMGAKAWFVDRMVWLYEDMKDDNPTYAAWLKR